jgi:NTP pyrophosphatase (non-canonical NTP hydrolase)
MKHSEKTLNELQQITDGWIKTVGVRYFNELTNTALLMEEVGELARLMARTYGEQSFKESENNSSIDEEMADVLWVLICLANQTGVNLTDAFMKKYEKRTLRDNMRHQQNPKLK